MAASLSHGQALTLLDCLGLHTPDRSRLHERFLVQCFCRLPPTTPPTLVSALPELQRKNAHHLRAVPNRNNRLDVEQPILHEGEIAPRKNRRKKSSPRGCEESNGTATPRRKGKQDIRSLVRTVDNAEDNSNESSTTCIAALHKLDGTESEDKCIEGEQSPVDNLDHKILHTPELNYEAKSRLENHTAGDASEVHTRQHTNASGKIIETLGNGTDTFCNTLSIGDTSSNDAATASRRNPGQRRRKKSDSELSQQDCSEPLPAVDVSSEAVRLECDAKIGVDVPMDINGVGFDRRSEEGAAQITNVSAFVGRALVATPQGQKGRRMPKIVKKSKKLQLPIEAFSVSEQSVEVAEPDQAMCTVRWQVETHLDVNQNLFLVGEHPNLGAWDPSRAIAFSLSEKPGNFNIWQGQSQLPFGTSSEYTYFVELDDGTANHTVWRPGTRLNFATPCKGLGETDLIIKDALDFNIANKLPALLWEGLQHEIGFPTDLKRFFGDNFVLKESSSDFTILENDFDNSYPRKHKGQPDLHAQSLPIEAKKEDLHIQHVFQVENGKSDISACNVQDVLFADKPQPDVASIASVRLTPKLQRYIRKRVFPREEPWLMESMILLEKSDVDKQADANLAPTTSHEVDVDENREVTEKNADKVEKLIEILINSSKCTMERIAILENGKLVELLLKPVNSDINVGNVYLGVVKKLLPGMTGVFVDIGHPRVALLSITKNMYPFTFPPIGGGSTDPERHLSEKNDVLSAEPFGADGECDDTAEDEWETENEEEEEDVEAMVDMEELADPDSHSDAFHEDEHKMKRRGRKLLLVKDKGTRPITVNFGQRFTKWRKVEEGMRIIVQVKREPLGKKGPKVCAFPHLSSRFWVLGLGGKSTGVSKKIFGPERKRLKDLANLFKKPGFELTVRTEAAGQSQEDLEKDLARLLDTWKDIMEQAESASFAAQNGQDGAVPALLHRAMGQTLSLVRDFFAEKVQRMVVDSAQIYHEVMCYLQEVAPQLQNRVELYTGTTPIFDVFNLEADIDKILNERVQLPNGAYLVIEETEALVTIDVNGGAGMLGKNMKSAAILEANLAAARQIAAELRLRDIGGIIVIDFIDMDEEEHESLVYEEMQKAIQSDRSIIFLSEISELGLMELTRRRVRPSVSFMISDACSCCHGTGRVEALETTFSKIERAILRLVANDSENIHFDGRTWKKVLLRVDPVMFEFLTRKQRAAKLSSSLKVYIILKVGREMSRGSFDLSELKLENEKQASRSGQQGRSARRGVRVGAGGGKKGITSKA